MGAAPAIGIDIGGTTVKGGLISPAGDVLVKDHLRTSGSEGPEAVVSQIVALARSIRQQSSAPSEALCGVGVGCPGPLSYRDGIVYETANMTGWDHFPLRDRLAEALELPVVIENDANAAALGEFHFGAGRGASDMVLVTLGTGVGAGVIVDGKLMRGAGDNAGEIGHTIVALRGRACPCGQSGCLERYSSANAVAQRYEELVRTASPSTPLANRVLAGETVDASDIVAACRHDEIAAQVWDEACFYLAIACVNLQHILNPQRIVLGGGMAKACAELLDPVRAHFEKLTWSFQRDHPAIEIATLGGDAGIIGAAALGQAEFAK
jgi:glucokinase